MNSDHIVFTSLAPKGVAGHSGRIQGPSDLLYRGYQILVLSGPRAGNVHHFHPAEFSSGGSDPVPTDSQ